MHNKERAVSLEQSSGIYFKMAGISTPVKEGTYTLTLHDSAGQILDGRVTFTMIENSPNEFITDITIEGSCVKRSGMEVTTEGRHEHLRLKLRLTSTSSKTSNPNTSLPSRHT